MGGTRTIFRRHYKLYEKGHQDGEYVSGVQEIRKFTSQGTLYT